MKRYLVTGAAGFIGTNLVKELCQDGSEVHGIDSFHPYYSKTLKNENVESLRDLPNFNFDKWDIREINESQFENNFDCIFHLAGQPGVRDSWGANFTQYAENNFLGTQRILDLAIKLNVPRVVFASSSSVYGNASKYPTTEEERPVPISPYGVSKLGCEQLGEAFTISHNLKFIALRYFTVFGPRQRPDMAINRIIRSTLRGETFSRFGSGTQIRDFTFVSDIVAATISAAIANLDYNFEVLNISGGNRTSLNEVISEVESITKASLRVEKLGDSLGDVTETGADINKAKRLLNWEPNVSLREGLFQQVEWQQRQIK